MRAARVMSSSNRARASPVILEAWRHFSATTGSAASERAGAAVGLADVSPSVASESVGLLTPRPNASEDADVLLADVERQLVVESNGKYDSSDPAALIDLYSRSIRGAKLPSTIERLLQSYIREPSPAAPRGGLMHDAAVTALPPSKPLAVAFTRLGELGGVKEAVALARWAWRVSATPVGPGRGAAPRVDVHSSALIALFTELGRPAHAAAGRRPQGQRVSGPPGRSSSEGEGEEAAVTEAPPAPAVGRAFSPLARANAAAEVLSWAIAHRDSGRTLWQRGEEGRSEGAATSLRETGSLPVAVFNAALRVWGVHGLPSPYRIAALGWRTGSRDKSEGQGRLTRALALAAEEGKLVPLSLSPNVSRAEQAYLWQARGGLFLPARGAITPPLAYATVGADALIDPTRSPSEPIGVAAHSLRQRVDSARATGQAVASKLGRTPSVVALGPRGYSPLIDLPLDASPSLRLITGVLREVTGTTLQHDGAAAPFAAPEADAAPNSETLCACFSVCARPTDVIAVGRIAVDMGLRLTTGPALALGVTRAVETGGVAEAHALLELAQAQDNAAAAIGRSGAGLPTLRTIPAEMADFESWVAGLSASDPVLRSFLTSLERVGRAEGLPLPVLRRLQALAAERAAYPVVLPSITATPSAGMSEGYAALVRTAAGQGANVQALAAWEAMQQAGAAVSIATVRAVLKASLAAGLPCDVYALCGWLEGKRGFVRASGEGAPVLAALASSQVPHAGDGATTAWGVGRAIDALAEVYAAALDVSRAPASPAAAAALATSVEVLAAARLVDPRAAANAARADGSDALRFARVPLSLTDALAPLASSALLGGSSPPACLADVRAVSGPLLVTVLDSLTSLGDAEAVAAVVQRELGRLAVLATAQALGGGSTPAAPILASSVVARASVRCLAVCGDLTGALAAARAFLVAGASLAEEDLLTIVLSVLTPEDAGPAFRALELMAAIGVAPTGATRDALATMTATLARRGARVHAEVAAAIGSEDAPSTESALLRSSLSALATEGLADAVIADITSGGGRKALPATSSGAVAARSSGAHPLTEAARAARVMSTSIITWTCQQMSLVAMQHHAVREGEEVQPDADEEPPATQLPQGPGAADEAEADGDDAGFLVAAREMLLLTVAEWPVSDRVARRRRDLDIASVRRARVARVRAEMLARLARPPPSIRADAGQPPTLGQVLSWSASWDEFTAAVRSLPVASTGEDRPGVSARGPQSLPRWGWGPPLFWRPLERGINPDEDGSGRLGACPVWASGSAADGQDASTESAAPPLSWDDAKAAAADLLRTVNSARLEEEGATAEPPAPASVTLLRHSAARRNALRASRRGQAVPALGDSSAAVVETAARILAQAGGYARSPWGGESYLARTLLRAGRPVPESAPLPTPSAASVAAAEVVAISSLKRLQDRLASAVRAGLRSSVLLGTAGKAADAAPTAQVASDTETDVARGMDVIAARAVALRQKHAAWLRRGGAKKEAALQGGASS